MIIYILKFVQFLKDNHFSENDVSKMEECNIFGMEKTFNEILKSKGGYYSELLDDIETKKTLMYNINEIVEYYKCNKNYYKARDFLKEHRKSPKYFFEQIFDEYEDNMYGIIKIYTINIKLFDTDFFTIDGFITHGEEINTKIDYKKKNQYIFFGTNNIIEYSDNKIYIDIKNETESNCIILLDIFNELNILKQIEKLKL